MMTTINEILTERGRHYGPFTGHAAISQQLKQGMAVTLGWRQLDADQRECLEMVAHKIARILNGDPDYLDSWVDIVGYVQLVVDRLRADQGIKP